MDNSSIVKNLQVDNMSHDEQMALLDSIQQSIKNSKVKQKERANSNAQLVVQALKKIKQEVETRFDELNQNLEEKGKQIVKGAQGLAGRDGKDGKDGKQGIDGRDGRDGKDGKDGNDGVDGVSVTDAKIDFDGSLVITLSTGQELNVGEVVPADIAEKIRVVTTMSTNGSVAILDEGTSITSGVKSLNFVGSGVTATTSGDNVTVTVAGGGGSGTVTSVAATVPSFLSVAGSPITTSGTLAITLSGTALPIANGGTGATTLAGASITTYSGTETLTNKTLTNPTITNYTETLYSANTGTAITVDLANGTVQKLTLTGNATITMPTATAGKSFVMILAQDGTGSRTVTWSTVVWPSATAPTITSTASKRDILSFFSDGTSWFGTTIGQNY
jgi:hypothetical protein